MRRQADNGTGKLHQAELISCNIRSIIFLKKLLGLLCVANIFEAEEDKTTASTKYGKEMETHSVGAQGGASCPRGQESAEKL